MSIPSPTPIYRLIHVDNLSVCLRRNGLHAPNFAPNDGLSYKTIHNIDIQNQRHIQEIPCGPRGVIHDYVSFYFGYLSPMLLQLKTGRVPDYNEGQAPLIYLASTAQAINDEGIGFVFSDGHGIAAFTSWFDDLKDLDSVDWNMVYEKWWADNLNNMDRQRRKQAEFLIHRICDWRFIHEIAVYDAGMKKRVEGILAQFPPTLCRNVVVKKGWYY